MSQAVWPGPAPKLCPIGTSATAMSVELIGLSTAPATSGVTRRAPNLAGAGVVVGGAPRGFTGRRGPVLGHARQQRQRAGDGAELGRGQLARQRLGEPLVAVPLDPAH